MQLGQSNKKCSQNFGVKITLNSAVWNREKSKTNIKLCPKSENVGAKHWRMWLSNVSNDGTDIWNV